ncbi:hypothetical protein VCV18_004121 [Metarhizium anisopliae]
MILAFPGVGMNHSLLLRRSDTVHSLRRYIHALQPPLHAHLALKLDVPRQLKIPPRPKPQQRLRLRPPGHHIAAPVAVLILVLILIRLVLVLVALIKTPPQPRPNTVHPCLPLLTGIHIARLIAHVGRNPALRPLPQLVPDRLQLRDPLWRREPRRLAPLGNQLLHVGLQLLAQQLRQDILLRPAGVVGRRVDDHSRKQLRVVVEALEDGLQVALQDLRRSLEGRAVARCG